MTEDKEQIATDADIEAVSRALAYNNERWESYVFLAKQVLISLGYIVKDAEHKSSEAKAIFFGDNQPYYKNENNPSINDKKHGRRAYDRR